jgi:hypothetical protein
MTLTIELKPEVERLLRAVAKERGVSLEEVVPIASISTLPKRSWKNGKTSSTTPKPNVVWRTATLHNAKRLTTCERRGICDAAHVFH